MTIVLGSNLIVAGGAKGDKGDTGASGSPTDVD